MRFTSFGQPTSRKLNPCALCAESQVALAACSWWRARTALMPTPMSCRLSISRWPDIRPYSGSSLCHCIIYYTNIHGLLQPPASTLCVKTLSQRNLSAWQDLVFRTAEAQHTCKSTGLAPTALTTNCTCKLARHLEGLDTFVVAPSNFSWPVAAANKTFKQLHDCCHTFSMAQQLLLPMPLRQLLSLHCKAVTAIIIITIIYRRSS